VVDAFNKPEEALSHFKPDFYAMIITDIRMPVINGFELYRQVKKIDDKLKVAFMTAFEVYEDEFRKVFTNIDVKCFIKKPVSPSDLVTQVKEELADEITFAS
jgi:two-component SAPR family response regulator